VFPVARTLLATGLPVLLEKPPGTTLAEFTELRSIADKYGTPVLIGVNRRHYTVLNRALEDAGGSLAVTHVDVDWSEDAAHMLGRGFSAAQVGRMAFANSLHGIDLITYLAGRIPEPQVMVRKGTTPFDWSMGFQGVSERGTTVSFRSTWSSPGRWRLQFCSLGRRYVFAPLETCTVLQSGVKEERAIIPAPEDTTAKAGFTAQARAFIEMISTRKAPARCDFAAVAPSMELADRLTRALGA
jgi:predicted dehydrogenase